MAKKIGSSSGSRLGCSYRVPLPREVAPRPRLPTFASSACAQICIAAPSLSNFGFARSFSDAFEVQEHLGSGSFGTVHAVQDRSTGRRFAAKTMRKRFLGNLLDPQFRRRVLHEADIYLHMGRSRMKQGRLSEEQAAPIIASVLRAIAQCHARGVVLRDVKPENFLFLTTQPGAPLKAIDFGLAVYCTPGQLLSDRAGSAVYCAPETVRRRYGSLADVWSAGVIAYQLLLGRLPFTDEDGALLAPDLRLSRHDLGHRQLFASLLAQPLDLASAPWPSLSPAAQDLLTRLLDKEPGTRITAAEALGHPWLHTTVSRHTSPCSCPGPHTSTHALLQPVPHPMTDCLPPSHAGGPDLALLPPLPALLPSQHCGLMTSSTTDGKDQQEGQERGQSAGRPARRQAGQRVGRQQSGSEGPPQPGLLVAGPALPELPVWQGSGPPPASLVQRLQRWGCYARLKQASLAKMASLLAPQYQLDSAMSQGHANGSQHLPSSLTNTSSSSSSSSRPVEVAQVSLALLSGSFALEAGEEEQLLASFTRDGQGCIASAEWLAAMTEWSELQQDHEEWDDLVARTFSAINASGSGCLELPELVALVCPGLTTDCPVPDTIPAALRTALNDIRLAAAMESGAMPGAVGATEGYTSGSQRIDLLAFNRLLRLGPQDTLQLFDGRCVVAASAS
ncbi:kinase-like domain-containing protein [Haematococcus lacustris]